MNPAKKPLVLVSLAAVLAGGTLVAGAASDPAAAATEVQSGSVAIGDVGDAAMAAAAKIDSAQAATSAAKALSGKVIGTRLDREHGYLVWDVGVLDAQGATRQAKIDAGDGRLLAVEAGGRGHAEDRDDEYHGWKLWERNEHEEERD